MSPKSRGRPADRGRAKPRRQPVREVRLSDRVLRDGRRIEGVRMSWTPRRGPATGSDRPGSERRWAKRDAEQMLCLEVTSRVRRTQPAVPRIRRSAEDARKEAVDRGADTGLMGALEQVHAVRLAGQHDNGLRSRVQETQLPRIPAVEKVVCPHSPFPPRRLRCV